MNIELRNVKHSPSLSQETQAFTAAIYIDGVKAGTAENAGHGGMTFINPRECRERIEAHAATLPRRPWGFFVLPEAEQDFQPTADMLVDDLLSDFLMEKEVKGMVANRIAYKAKDKKGILQTKRLSAAQREQVLAQPGLREKWNVEVFLHEIPLAEAIALVRANS